MAFLSRMVLMSSTTAESSVTRALHDVRSRISAAVQEAGRETSHGYTGAQPRLVAVSKTKPPEMIQAAYDAGHRVFGENYVQEMVEKAPQLPQDISWHFIGHLQSNKVNLVLGKVPGLAMVETVDTQKLARKLDAAVANLGRPPLSVMVQVNTSGEESKYGVEPQDCTALADFIASQCPNLRLAGLMTIGMPDYSSRPSCFECLARCQSQVAKALGLEEDALELSMGMSGDFEEAIAMGSSNIRVGSTIFGARDYSKR